MNTRYISARNAALGLEEGTPLPARKNYEGVVIGQRAEVNSEMFSKTFEIPPEIIVRKSVLSLFEEYEADYERAHSDVKNVSRLLSEGKTEKLSAFLQKKPPIEWLNCIFLEDEDLDSFAIVLEKADRQTLSILLAAIRNDLKRLVQFTKLFETILENPRFNG
jgi:hypothetical protein